MSRKTRKLLIELPGTSLAQNDVDDYRCPDYGSNRIQWNDTCSPGNTHIKLQSNATAPPLKMVTGSREL